MADLDSLSVEQLLALKQQTAPVATATPAPVNLDSLSVDELMKLKNSTVNQDWNLADSAANFMSGVAEGTTGMIGLAADLNPLQPGGPKFDFPSSRTISGVTDSLLAEKDPQYRYARTLGNFAAPVPIKGANNLRTLLTSLIAGVGAQGAEDFTGDKKIAPIVGAVATGSLASGAEDLFGLLKRVFVGSNADEITGSAAKAFAERTGLTTQDLATVNNVPGPQTQLDSLRTTAEKTGNAGVAQIEKTLASEGQNANIYAALDTERANAREAVLSGSSSVRAVNDEALGADLINTSTQVQGRMRDNSSAFWGDFPRDIPVNIGPEQEVVARMLGARQGGLPPGSKVRTLVDQFLETPVQNSGRLQDIREDVLALRRTENLSPLEDRVTNAIQGGIADGVPRSLEGRSANIWEAGRQSTAAEKDAFERGTAGGYLVSDNARVSNVLEKVFKGDRQSITELRTAIGESPRLLEQVKTGVLKMIPRDVQQQLTPAKMKNFLDSNETGLQELFGDVHYENFRRVAEDLASQADVQNLANLASKGTSATSQRVTVAGAVQNAITESLTPGIGGRFSGIINEIKRGAGLKDAKAVEDLLFKAALDSNFAEQLSKAPTNRRIFNALETLANAKDNIGKTAAIVTGKELGRDQDNRTPLGQLIDKTLGDTTAKKGSETSSLASKVLGKPATQAQPEFNAKVKDIADKLGADPEHLMQAMSFETGGTFDPAEKNKAGSGATGLIQFMPATAKELLGTETAKEAIDKLSKMSATEQLDYVEKYLKPYKGKLKSLDDVYMAILYPKAIGKDSDFELFKKGTEAYWKNRGLDINEDGAITKGEAVSKVRTA